MFDHIVKQFLDDAINYDFDALFHAVFHAVNLHLHIDPARNIEVLVQLTRQLRFACILSMKTHLIPKCPKLPFN